MRALLRKVISWWRRRRESKPVGGAVWRDTPRADALLYIINNEATPLGDSLREETPDDRPAQIREPRPRWLDRRTGGGR